MRGILVMLIAVSLVARSTASGSPLTPGPSKIIGGSDFVPVSQDGRNVPREFRGLLDAIGWTNYGCTVFHLGQGFALTAGHCFDATPDLRKDQSCRFVQVEWGYRADRTPYLRSQCSKIIAMIHNEQIDFALFKVDKEPAAAVSIDLDAPSTPGQTMTIFSHPEGAPLQWSQYCPILGSDHPKIAPERLHYECDTLGGSSGAPIFSAQTGQVIGVHNGGWQDRNYGSVVSREPLRSALIEALE